MSTQPAVHGPDGPPEPDPEETVQMNVRIPRRLLNRVDERRGRLNLSRDKWVIRVLEHVLKEPGNPNRTVATTTRGRSVKPARRGKR